jgi:IS5 family transposase
LQTLYYNSVAADPILTTCAAGFNIRWLLRMIVKKGIGLFLRLLQVAALGQIALQLRQIFISPQLKSGSMNSALA